jgi:hypothetical protein
MHLTQETLLVPFSRPGLVRGTSSDYRSRSGSGANMKIRPPGSGDGDGDGDEDDEPIEKPEPYFDKAKARLGKFFEANSASSLRNAGSEVLIDKPWGDSSLAIMVPHNFGELAIALDNVFLPPQLTAIWHSDKKELEVIYTAYKLPPYAAEVIGRKFKFTYEGVLHTCEFAKSSDRLLTIAKHTLPLTASVSQHRNMNSYANYMQMSEDDRDRYQMNPISFWIRKIPDWNDDKIIQFVTHLNFYLSYYDALGPNVIIHFNETFGPTPQTRYRAGKFPNNITARALDENLMSLWGAAQTGDAARRFLYFYRIIEYSSLLYVEENVKGAMRRILAAPNLADDFHGACEKLFVAMSESRMDDVARFNAVVRECVDINHLWREISLNISAFNTETVFDGGFKLGPIVGIGLTADQFAVKGHEIFARAIREIRNALTHGRDLKSSMIILPTRKNFRLLEPWVQTMSIAAGDVVLLKVQA